MEQYDVVIIGSGPGGTAAAKRLASAGKRVAIVESRHWGGACLNRGCMPTKLFLGAAAPLGMLEGLARRNIVEGSETINFSALRERVRRFVESRRHQMALGFIRKGITLLRGFASCIDPHTIRIEERDGTASTVGADFIIFATGSHTATYPGLKPDGKTILSSTGLLKLGTIPESLLISGGGTIGVEMADFFFHMGTRIIIAEAAPQLAPTEDEDVASLLRMHLERLDILCLTGVRATSLVRNKANRAHLTLADGAIYTAEKGLIASGRQPNTDNLKAENAGCALNRRGFITTDYFLRSSPNSWAIGDVNGKLLLAHAASHQGEYVARTILGQEQEPYSEGPAPFCIRGSFEIMRAGITEREAAALGGDVLVSRAHLANNVMSHAEGNPHGFVKVVWRNGTMAGISAIGAGVTQLTLPAQLLLLGQFHGEKLHTFMTAHPSLEETLIAAIRAQKKPSEQ